jgi:GrpB-like predicted nucleotidyltransferase (UPF0157 family)
LECKLLFILHPWFLCIIGQNIQIKRLGITGRKTEEIDAGKTIKTEKTGCQERGTNQISKLSNNLDFKYLNFNIMELSKEAKEAKNAYQREWRRRNPEKQRMYLNKWLKKNPEKRKQYQQRYWERKAQKIDIVSIRVKELHRAGRSLRQIADEVGINHMKVSRILKEN